MDNMEYYTQRLQCSDAEKDACLETIVKLYRLRYYLRQEGFLAAEVVAEGETDPFFSACLMEFGDVSFDSKEAERRFTQYLMAGDYRGGAFLNAVLISQGLVLLARYDGGTEECLRHKYWDELLAETLGGYFGVEYREKVTEVIRREDQFRMAQKKYLSKLLEFDDLTKLAPWQRDWLVRHVSSRTLCYALSRGGSAVSEFLMEGLENREEFERDLCHANSVGGKDVEEAQREILNKAKEIPECM